VDWVFLDPRFGLLSHGCGSHFRKVEGMMMAVAAVAVHPVTHMARAGATTQEVREYLRLHDVAVGDSEGD
jgi:hypothetical protein